MEETTWAQWLEEALAERGWTQAEFVRQSQGHIKADRISKWLSGKEVASHKFAVIAANTLGKPHSDALRAAGFTDAADLMDRRRSMLNAHLGITRPSQGQLIEALKDVPDSDILRILQIRAEQREGHGSKHSSNVTVGRFGDTTHPTPEQAVAYEDDGDTGEDLE